MLPLSFHPGRALQLSDACDPLHTSCLLLSCAVAAGGGDVPGRPPPQRGHYQLFPSVCRRPPRVPTLPAGR